MPCTAASDVTRRTASCAAPLGGEPLEHRVGVRREADVERPDVTLLADAVEHDDATRTADGDEAREHVDELVAVGEAAGVERFDPSNR